MKRFFWDFFGPRAQGTAEHFLIHLRQFLEKSGCAELPCGLTCEAPGHYAVYCVPTEAFRESIECSLRPRRSTDE